jgi:diaminopimelate decarboxylase
MAFPFMWVHNNVISDNGTTQLPAVKYLFDAVAEEGIELKMINIGGGFPANYVDPTFSVNEYAEEILRFIRKTSATIARDYP